MSLSEVARALYALPPAEFTEARTARAREAADAGDKELAARIRRVPKPPVAAWAVNALVGHRSDAVDELLELGERMREATAELDRDALRELGRDRHRMLAAIGRSARELGDELGVAVSEAAATQVQQTFQAALADPSAAAAVSSGLLVRPLASDGLGPPDLEGAMAAVPASKGSAAPRAPGDADSDGDRDEGEGDDPTRAIGRDDSKGFNGSRGPSATDRAKAAAAKRTEERRLAHEAAEREAAEAQQAADEAAVTLEQIDDRIEQLHAAHARLTSEQRELQKRLDALQDELSAATAESAALRRERVTAKRTADAAARAASRARASIRPR